MIRQELSYLLAILGDQVSVSTYISWNTIIPIITARRMLKVSSHGFGSHNHRRFN